MGSGLERGQGVLCPNVEASSGGERGSKKKRKEKAIKLCRYFLASSSDLQRVRPHLRLSTVVYNWGQETVCL